MKVADYIAYHIDAIGKTQRQIASEAGFDNPNVVSMMRNGVTKVPMLRVPALAASLGVQADDLLRRCFEEYEPELWRVLQATMPGVGLSNDEVELVATIKRALGATPAAVCP